MVFFTSNHCPTSHGVEERLLAFLDEMGEDDLSFVAINPNHPDGLSVLHHSSLKLSTGLATAARIACQLTVSSAIPTAAATATANIHHWIAMW